MSLVTLTNNEALLFSPDQAGAYFEDFPRTDIHTFCQLALDGRNYHCYSRLQ